MTSSGLEFNMNIDDEGLTSPEGLAQSQLAKAVVSLPVGLTTNPFGRRGPVRVLAGAI